ncbi:MAG: hypothetical protein AAF849_14950 [Bacteroidota bacterium]
MEDKENKKHRGRLQAQSKDTEKSVNWAQDEPLSKEDGLNLLGELKSKLTKKEYEEREKQFKKVERLIKNSQGIDAHYARSFRNIKSKDKSTRLDVEVHSGTAFVCILVILAILFYLFK